MLAVKRRRENQIMEDFSFISNPYLLPEIWCKIFIFLLYKNGVSKIATLRIICKNWKQFIDEEILSSKRFSQLIHLERSLKSWLHQPVEQSSLNWTDIDVLRSSKRFSYRIQQCNENPYFDLLLGQDCSGICVIMKYFNLLGHFKVPESHTVEEVRFDSNERSCFVLTSTQNAWHLFQLKNREELETLSTYPKSIIPLAKLASIGNYVHVLTYHNRTQKILKEVLTWPKRKLIEFQNCEPNLVDPEFIFDSQQLVLFGSISDFVQVFDFHSGSKLYNITGPLYKLEVGMNPSILFIKSSKCYSFFHKRDGSLIRNQPINTNCGRIQNSVVKQDFLYCVQTQRNNKSISCTILILDILKGGLYRCNNFPVNSALDMIYPLNHEYILIGFQKKYNEHETRLIRLSKGDKNNHMVIRNIVGSSLNLHNNSPMIYCSDSIVYYKECGIQMSTFVK